MTFSRPCSSRPDQVSVSQSLQGQGQARLARRHQRRRTSRTRLPGHLLCRLPDLLRRDGRHRASLGASSSSLSPWGVEVRERKAEGACLGERERARDAENGQRAPRRGRPTCFAPSDPLAPPETQYDRATNVAYFKAYLTEAYARFKKPLWLTEVRKPLARRFVVPSH